MTERRDVVLEKGIAIPGYGRRIYDWHKLEIGDCLTFHNRSSDDIKGLARNASKRLGIKLTVRKLHGMVRVWRVT